MFREGEVSMGYQVKEVSWDLVGNKKSFQEEIDSWVSRGWRLKSLLPATFESKWYDFEYSEYEGYTIVFERSKAKYE
jgi:hypothetical protein